MSLSPLPVSEALALPALTAAPLPPPRRQPRDWSPALFLAPNFLGFAVFVAGPVIFSMFAAFTDWDLTRPGDTRFVGLANFRALFANDRSQVNLLNRFTSCSASRSRSPAHSGWRCCSASDCAARPSTERFFICRALPRASR